MVTVSDMRVFCLALLVSSGMSMGQTYSVDPLDPSIMRIDDGFVDFNPIIRNASPKIETVYIGDGMGAARSAGVRVNSGMGYGNAFHAIFDSDGYINQGSGNKIVRFSALSGDAGEIRLSTNNAQLMEVIGTAGDSTFGGLISGGVTETQFLFDIDGGSRFRKNGPSTLTLTGANTYVTRTIITGGAIRVQSDDALGAKGALSNATLVGGDGSLQVVGNTTLSELIYLNGPGANGNGALHSVSGNNAISSNLTVGWENAGGANGGRGPTITVQDSRIGVDAGSELEVTGNVEGTGNLEKVGDGVLRLSGTNNTRSGNTTVSGGTLELASSGLPAIAGSSLTLNSGGTLLLEGAEQISDTTNLTLNGGTFVTNSFDETLGTLTLTSNSEISLASNIHLLSFGDSLSTQALWNLSSQLTITGWAGDRMMSGTLGRIYVGDNDATLSSAQLGRIAFDGFGVGAALLPDGELVPAPVPEARTVLAAVILVGLVAWRERRRLASLLRQRTVTA